MGVASLSAEVEDSFTLRSGSPHDDRGTFSPMTRASRETAVRLTVALLLVSAVAGALVTGAAAQDAGRVQVTATVPVVAMGIGLSAGRAPATGPVPHVVVDTLSEAGAPVRVRITIFFE